MITVTTRAEVTQDRQPEPCANCDELVWEMWPGKWAHIKPNGLGTGWTCSFGEDGTAYTCKPLAATPRVATPRVATPRKGE